jgi:hypothetical protein
MTTRTQADAHYVTVARRYGCREGLARIIVEQARRWSLPISLGFALCDKESGFRNVFGHDPTICVGWGAVTRVKYLAYRARRRASGNRLMQGIGVCQLTWWQTQDLADARGGCHKSEHNISVGFQTLAARIREHGYVVGCARYNGSGPDADAYSRDLRARADTWHRRLAS